MTGKPAASRRMPTAPAATAGAFSPSPRLVESAAGEVVGTAIVPRPGARRKRCRDSAWPHCCDRRPWRCPRHRRHPLARSTPLLRRRNPSNCRSWPHSSRGNHRLRCPIAVELGRRCHLRTLRCRARGRLRRRRVEARRRNRSSNFRQRSSCRGRRRPTRWERMRAEPRPGLRHDCGRADRRRWLRRRRPHRRHPEPSRCADRRWCRRPLRRCRLRREPANSARRRRQLRSSLIAATNAGRGRFEGRAAGSRRVGRRRGGRSRQGNRFDSGAGRAADDSRRLPRYQRRDRRSTRFGRLRALRFGRGYGIRSERHLWRGDHRGAACRCGRGVLSQLAGGDGGRLRAARRSGCNSRGCAPGGRRVQLRKYGIAHRTIQLGAHVDRCRLLFLCVGAWVQTVKRSGFGRSCCCVSAAWGRRVGESLGVCRSAQR